jgi:hypothetical protein
MIICHLRNMFRRMNGHVAVAVANCGNRHETPGKGLQSGHPRLGRPEGGGFQADPAAGAVSLCRRDKGRHACGVAILPGRLSGAGQLDWTSRMSGRVRSCFVRHPTVPAPKGPPDLVLPRLFGYSNSEPGSSAELVFSFVCQDLATCSTSLSFPAGLAALASLFRLCVRWCKRVDHRQLGEAREIPVSGPENTHAVEKAEGGNPGIVYERTL